MLAGVRREAGGRPKEEIRAEIRSMWAAFGLKSQQLARLLGEVPV